MVDAGLDRMADLSSSEDPVCDRQVDRAMELAQVPSYD